MTPAMLAVFDLIAQLSHELALSGIWIDANPH